jgi:hypothetical protein
VKKLAVTFLFVLCAAASAFAGEAAVTPAPDAVTVDAAVATAAPMTLSAALDKVARDYREMWIPDREGKKVKRACDFQCTQECDYWRTICQQGGTSNPECSQQWNLCMCENSCCWGPTGNPYCN